MPTYKTAAHTLACLESDGAYHVCIARARAKGTWRATRRTRCARCAHLFGQSGAPRSVVAAFGVADRPAPRKTQRTRPQRVASFCWDRCLRCGQRLAAYPQPSPFGRWTVEPSDRRRATVLIASRPKPQSHISDDHRQHGPDRTIAIAVAGLRHVCTVPTRKRLRSGSCPALSSAVS